jgi:hypothetical protein
MTNRMLNLSQSLLSLSELWHGDHEIISCDQCYMVVLQGVG